MAYTNGHSEKENGASEVEEITVFELELEDDGSPTKERSVSALICMALSLAEHLCSSSTSVCRRQSSRTTCACRSRLVLSPQKQACCTPTSRSTGQLSSVRNSIRRCTLCLSALRRAHWLTRSSSWCSKFTTYVVGLPALVEFPITLSLFNCRYLTLQRKQPA